MDYNFSSILERLKKSKFRASFKLSQKDMDIVNKKGIETIKQHAKEILTNRIKIKKPNDGKQTPLKGYPVFIAQHATATCCRSCMKKWYNLPEDKILSDEELDFFAELIIEWIKMDCNNL